MVHSNLAGNQLSAQCSGLWISSEVGCDLVSIKTSNFCCVHQVVLMLTSLHLNEKSREVCINERSPPASFAFIAQVTMCATVKWPNVLGVKIHDEGLCMGGGEGFWGIAFHARLPLIICSPLLIFSNIFRWHNKRYAALHEYYGTRWSRERVLPMHRIFCDRREVRQSEIYRTSHSE